MKRNVASMIVATLTATAVCAGLAVAQDAAEVPGADATEAVSPAAPAARPAAADAGAGQALQAIVMDVLGKARWRAGPDAEWHDAKVNDLLDPGVEVRTGLRSRLTMRVGRNATVLVDSGTSFTVSEIAAEGGTLRTTAAVKTGRVDFKVDKVGFANDFKVVTPQTTLAVRGTGFSLATGPLNGFEITGARTNAINAIELRYAVDNARFFLSGNARSSSEHQEPAHNAWLSTVGPPPIVGALANHQQLVQQIAQGTAGNAPTNPQQFQQQNAAESNGTGGNALIQAANQDGASDDLKDLARDVTGNNGAVPPNDGSGDALLSQLRDPYLREQLQFARSEGPPLLQDLSQMNADSGALQGLSNALAAFYPEDDSPPSLRPHGFEGLAPDEGALQRVIALGDDLNSPLVSGNDRAAITTFITATESATGAALFTTSPYQTGPTGGTSLGSTGGNGPPWGLRTALQNVGMWATRDGLSVGQLAQTVGQMGGSEPGMSSEAAVSALRQMDALASRWTIDATVRGSGGQVARSPVLLTLTLNEMVQSSWDSAVRSMLSNVPQGNAIAQKHDQVAAKMRALIDRLGASHLGQTYLSLPDMRAEYLRAASEENTNASLQASQEHSALVDAARAALDQSLDSALEAANRAADARTQAQRVLMGAVSNAYLTQAASIATSCQSNAISVLESAASMLEQYRGAKDVMRGAGLLPSDLNRGRPGS